MAGFSDRSSGYRRGPSQRVGRHADQQDGARGLRSHFNERNVVDPEDRREDDPLLMRGGLLGVQQEEYQTPTAVSPSTNGWTLAIRRVQSSQPPPHGLRLPGEWPPQTEFVVLRSPGS